MNHWNNKSLVRAMAIESFKMFKPSAYNLIKADYGDYSGDFDDKFLLSSDWCPNHLTKIDKPKMEVEADKNYYTETRFAEFEFCIVNSVKTCIEFTLEKSSTNTTVAFSGLVKCVTCFESRPNSLYACPFCRCYLGCFRAYQKSTNLLCAEKSLVV